MSDTKILNLQLVDEYDDGLITPTAAWDFKTESLEKLQLICQSMVYRMVADGGIGLAANQVGLGYSIFVLGSNGNYAAIINPEIIEKSGEQVLMEGCLSAPGLFLKVKRAATIKARFYAIDGTQHEQEYTGLTAQVFQHEFDHLQGIRYQDKVSPILLQRAKAKVKVNQKRIKLARALALEEMERERNAANNQTLNPATIAQLQDALNSTNQAQPEVTTKSVSSVPPISPVALQSVPSGTVLDFSTGPTPTPPIQPPTEDIKLDFGQHVDSKEDPTLSSGS